jgi:hypothetical protein
MTQVKQNSPFFPESAEYYLLLHGWDVGEGHQFAGQYYTKGDEMITVKGDTIQFLTYHDEEEGQRKAAYSVCHAFTGIADLDDFGWMLLYHIAGSVPLKQFVKKARNSQEATLFNIMADHMRMSGARQELPINY